MFAVISRRLTRQISTKSWRPRPFGIAQLPSEEALQMQDTSWVNGECTGRLYYGRTGRKTEDDGRRYIFYSSSEELKLEKDLSTTSRLTQTIGTSKAV